MAQKRPYIDFQEVKEKVSIPDALQALGLLDQFAEKNGKYTGVCPIPTHEHGPSPNDQQFKFDNKRGEWLFKCFGDCNAGGDVIELVKRIQELSDEHVRFWFAGEFGDRLSTVKRKKAAAPATAVTTQEATVVGEQRTLKPLEFHLKLRPEVPYLAERGIEPQTIAKYGLGLCSKGVLEGYVAVPVYRYPKESADENPVGYVGRW